MVLSLPRRLIRISLILIGILQVQGFSDMVQADLESCKEEYNVTEADFARMKNKEAPETLEGKCFLECMMNKVDLMNGDRLNTEGAKGMIAEIEEISAEDKAKLSEVIDECSTEIEYREDEECENSIIVSTCISDKASQKGIQAPEEVAE